VHTGSLLASQLFDGEILLCSFFNIFSYILQLHPGETDLLVNRTCVFEVFEDFC